MISSPTKSISSSMEAQNRKKRCRVRRQSSLQLVSDDQMEKLGLGDETSLAKMNMSIQGLKSKEPPNEAKNYDHQLRRKRVSGIKRNTSNAGFVASLMNNLAPQFMLPHLAGKDVGNERRDVHKFGDISKEIDDVITRIKCLIPSLQRLVNSGQKDKVPTGNELGQVPNFLMRDEGMLSKQVNQVVGKSNDRAPLTVNQSHNVYCVLNDLLKQTALLQKEVNPKMDDIEFLSTTMSQTMIVQPLSLQAQWSQVPQLKAKANRARSLRRSSSRTESVASQTPENIKGLRIMPCQFRKERPNQSHDNQRQGTVKDAALRSQMAASPSLGSANFMRPNRMNNLCESDYKWINGHTGGRFAVKKGLPSQSTMKKINGFLQSEILQGHHGSQQSNSESPTSSSGLRPESGSCPSSSRTYGTTNRSDESKVQHGEGESSPGYDSLSFNSSEDQYSDMSHSSQRSEARPYKRVQHLERGKGAGRFRRFKNKIRKIFHHHHHHHHHYDDKDEVGYMRSFWKWVGSMFHHTRKDDKEKPKVNNPRKSVIKGMLGKKQQGGHFHALFGGLMKHLKHSKKAKQPIAGIGKSARKQQLPWLPKRLKRVGARMPNKGRVKLAIRTKRSPLATAKRFLRQ